MSPQCAANGGRILGTLATKGRIVTTIWATDQLADRLVQHPSADAGTPALHAPAAHADAARDEAVHADECVQQLVHDLMRERLNELFGPGGSFRVTLGRATQDDALFVSTVADTIAWEVAAALGEHERANPRCASQEMPADEHDEIWRHVEDELLKRRKAA